MAKVSYNNPNKVYPITLEECEGWTNKPTWIFNLSISNDEELYNHFQSDCRDIIERVVKGTTLAFNRESAIIAGTADLLKEWAQQLNHKHTWAVPSLLLDLAMYCLHLVDWIELAEIHIEEYLESRELDSLAELISKKDDTYMPIEEPVSD